jgi:hypothetical protein
MQEGVMSATANARGVLIAIGLLAIAAVTACSANQTPGSAGPSTGPGATAAESAAASSPVGAPSATPAASGSVENEVISSAEMSELTTAYAAWRGIPVSDIGGGGPLPGSVYYAYDPTTDTYWALADFEPSSTASLDVQVAFQDGGGIAMYQMAGGGSWQVQTAGAPSFCSEVKFFPIVVLEAWSMQTTPPTGLTC